MSSKRTAMRTIVVVGTTALVAGAWVAQGDEPKNGLRALEWLAGSWFGTIDGGQWEACYSTAEGGEIISANKEIRGGRVVMIEFERFTVDGDKIIMTPYPNGKRSNVSFTLVEHDVAKRKAVFTNPEHDFPSKIVYHRVADDNLTCEITGQPASASKPMVLRLNLKRR